MWSWLQPAQAIPAATSAILLLGPAATTPGSASIRLFDQNIGDAPGTRVQRRSPGGGGTPMVAEQHVIGARYRAAGETGVDRRGLRQITSSGH